MQTAIFLIVTILLIVYQKHREGRWLNLISLLMAPYVIIVFFNNYFVYKLGFYKISDDVIVMLLMAFVSFFCGTLLFKSKHKPHSEENNLIILEHYNINKIKWFLYIVGIAGLIKAIILYREGVFLNEDADSEGIMGNGIVAHMLLASYSVLPIYFLNWTYNKKIKELIPVILVLIVAFSSLIKYNVIGPVVTLFIFVSLYRASLLKKASLVMISFVTLFFVSNYMLGFVIAGVSSEVGPDFYIGHFWKYFSGSVIYDNYIFTTGIRVDTSIFYKLMTFIFALPNMFLGKFFDETYFPHVGQEMRDVSNFGEESNVVDAVGYLYSSKGELSDILLFVIVFLCIGMFVSYLYKRNMEKQTKYSVFLPNFLTYFVFLSFFAPFYVLSNPWEILVWALILPPFFIKSKNIFS